MDPSLRVTLNVHPDRASRGVAVLAALADDGLYRSQFETGTSNGGLTAHPGGDRWTWESRLFGGAYDAAAPAERPKYGALNYRRRPVGGSPRFGSAYLRLRPSVIARCTFCYPDSVFEPSHVGVASHMSLVSVAEADHRDPLDDYVEAHIHGPLRLALDTEALVLDPCFQDTEVEALARALPCPIEWHPGFELSIEILLRHPDFRGSAPVALGLAVAREGVITARMLGEAAREKSCDPAILNQLWHCVARYGCPASGLGPCDTPESRS